MRCKQGDIAVILRSSVPDDVDKLVTCVRLLPLVERCGVWGYEVGGPWLFPANQFDGPVWEVESLGSDLTVRDLVSGKRWSVRSRPCADKDLRPLRDNDEPDQMPRVVDREVTA